MAYILHQVDTESVGLKMMKKPIISHAEHTCFFLTRLFCLCGYLLLLLRILFGLVSVRCTSNQRVYGVNFYLPNGPETCGLLAAAVSPVL